MTREQGFRDRAKREDERFRLATDGEFWLAFCFRKPHQPAAFVAAFRLEQLPGTRYVPGPKLAAAVGDRTKLTAAQRVKQLLRIQGAARGRPAPLACPVSSAPTRSPTSPLPETWASTRSQSCEPSTAHSTHHHHPTQPMSWTRPTGLSPTSRTVRTRKRS